MFLSRNYRFLSVMYISLYFFIFSQFHIKRRTLSTDTFIIKRGSTSVGPSINSSTASLSPSQSSGSSNKIKNEITIKCCKYNGVYLNFGFMCIGNEINQIP